MVDVQKNLSKHERKKLKRLERDKHQQEQQTTHQKQKSSKKTITYSIIGVVIVIFAIGIFMLSSRDSGPGPYDDFADCLTAEGMTMYGAYWCPHCADQKKLFGSSVKKMPYVECAADGKNAQRDLCVAKGVTSYPTWIMGNDVYNGVLTLQRLAEITGCELDNKT